VSDQQVSEQQTAPAPGRRRGRETAADMVRSLLVVLALVLVVVAMNAQPQPEPKVTRFDYTVALEQAQDSAPYDVVAPVGLPDSWRATSARTGSNGDAVTWHLGFVTPRGDYAALEQSNADPENVLATLVGDGSDAGRVRIHGAVWRRVEGGEHAKRALVLDAEPVTTVVLGGASWRELRTLAGAVQVP
jgi:hypothetical protein